jgi:hypothetical protein
MTRYHPPIYGPRTYPTAHRIAYDLKGDTAMLRHRTPLLASMVAPMYRVSTRTAAKAIAIARRA